MHPFLIALAFICIVVAPAIVAAFAGPAIDEVESSRPPEEIALRPLSH